MPNSPSLEEIILPAWHTNARVTHLFLTSLPATIWDHAIPGAPRRTPRMQDLLRLGCAHGGRVPPTAAYVWRNLALDVGHVLTYFVAHEGHHRGQLTLLARQFGAPLPEAARNGLWQWKPPRSS